MQKPNITREVWNYISRDLAIQKHLGKNLINMRALAKYITTELKLKASTDSVISAIRRYSSHNDGLGSFNEMGSFFKGSNVITRNNMACIILRNQANIHEYLSNMSKIMDFEKGEPLRLIKGRSSLRILADMKSIEKIKKSLPKKEHDFEIKENLSEIKIKIALKAEKTKGVAARISNELTLQGINISEMLFCIPEIIIYVDQSDLLKAHEGLVKLCCDMS
ncbi:MAG: hypothetical protein KKA79_08255 [Nanoarchaeota archaeon]|nr:hypothetical protein [Nanoarchaeota archaeon]